MGRYYSQDGLFLGLAFPWLPRYTEALELFLATTGEPLPTATDTQGGHPILRGIGALAERPLYLPFPEMVGQTGIKGTTRSGKTYLLRLLAYGSIFGPGATILFDPKGDRQLLATAALAARRRGKRFVFIAPAFPAYSSTINPLANAFEPDEVAAHIKVLMPSAGGHAVNPFYEQYPLSLIENLSAAQRALGQRWTLAGLGTLSLHERPRKQLLLDYLLHIGAVYTEKQKTLEQRLKAAKNDYGLRLNDELANELIETDEHEKTHLHAITSNLRPTFRGLLTPPRGPLFSPDANDPSMVTWQEIVEEEMVVYISLSSMMLKDTANRLGRIILQDLISFLGRRYAYQDMATALPLTIMVDEAGDVLYPGFIDALNKGGGALARFIVAMQSRADADVSIGQLEAERLYDNLSTRIWFRLASIATAEDAAKHFGECYVELPTPPRLDHGYGDVGGLSGRTGMSIERKPKPVLRDTWFTALPRGNAFMRMKGALFYLTVPMMPEVSPAELDVLELTEIWNSMKEQEARQAMSVVDVAMPEEEDIVDVEEVEV